MLRLNLIPGFDEQGDKKIQIQPMLRLNWVSFTTMTEPDDSNTTNVKVKPKRRGSYRCNRTIQIQPMLRLNHVFKGFMFNTIPQKA